MCEETDGQIDFGQNRLRFLGKILTTLTLQKLGKSSHGTSDRK